MLKKSRSLPFSYGDPDIGPDHLYYASGSNMNDFDAVNLRLDRLSGIMEKRAEGIANAATPFSNADLAPNTIGRQNFMSTENRPPYFNKCINYRTEGVNYPYSVTYMTSETRVHLLPFMRSLTWGSVSNPIVAHFNVELDQAQRTAWGIMQPRFEGDVSMFNFVVELRDFKRIAKFLLKNPLRKIRNLIKRIIRKRRFDPTKPIAQLHLSNEFALKPLLSDIYKLSCQLDAKITDIQKSFADAGRERNKRHYSEVFPIYEYNRFSDYEQSKYPWLMKGNSEQLMFNATMEYSYEYNMRSTLSAFSKYYGVLPDTEAIWDAIPFSFIVDYFLKVGDALDINSRDKNVLLDLHQYCESILSERTNGMHFKASYLFGPMLGSRFIKNPGSSGNYLVSGSESSLYTRYVAQPKTGSVMPRLHRPSTKQGWNMLALLRAFF